MSQPVVERGSLFGFENARIVRAFLIGTGVLVFCHTTNVLLGSPSWQIFRFFALGKESNLPTWFSGVLWFTASIAALQCSRLVARTSVRDLWRIVALGLMACSIDEVAKIHENIFAGLARRVIVPEAWADAFSHSMWPVVGIPLFLLAMVWFGSNFKTLFAGSAVAGRRMVVGITMVAVGALGLDFSMNLLEHGPLEWVWYLESICEETLEMTGAIVIISALFVHRSVLFSHRDSERQGFQRNVETAGSLKGVV